jgi:hypothetical protein
VQQVFVRPLVHAGIIYMFTILCQPNVFVLDVLGSSIYMALVVMCALRQGMLALTWTWVVILAFVCFWGLYPLVVTIIDSSTGLYGPGVPLLTLEPTAYAITALCMASIVLLEYATSGWARVDKPSPLHVLMEIDRGYSEGQRPRVHGLKDAMAAIAEGTDRVIVLPAKLIKEAFAKRLQRRPATAAGFPDDDALLADVHSARGSGLRGRSGFDFSAPTSGATSDMKNDVPEDFA